MIDSLFLSNSLLCVKIDLCANCRPKGRVTSPGINATVTNPMTFNIPCTRVRAQINQVACKT
jgi:hypothetical protein